MSEIDNKIRADLFRKRIEDKNQLTGAGAIYVGTGKKTEIEGAGVSGITGTYYETTGIAPSGNREIPISVANESGNVTGLKFKNIETILGEQELKITGQTGFQINTSTGPIGFSGEKISITGSQSISALGKTIMLTGQSFLINGTDGTEISNISTRSNFKDSTNYTLYTAPSGTPSLSNNGETGTYKNDTSERNLAPIIYNIGQRLDSLGFKELGGDFNSAFEFELKKTYKSESGGSAIFTLGTLKIAPQDVMGNYCRAVVKFEPVQIDKVKLTATDYDYTHASDDDQRRLLFYCSTYFLYEPATGKTITDVTGESDFSYNNMNRFNNTVITPAEEIEFSFPFSIDVYSTYEGGDLVLEAASITVHFVLTPPGADGKTRVQMKIHSQNFNAIAQTYRIRIPGEATIDPFPIIAYKRKI